MFGDPSTAGSDAPTVLNALKSSELVLNCQILLSICQVISTLTYVKKMFGSQNVQTGNSSAFFVRKFNSP